MAAQYGMQIYQPDGSHFVMDKNSTLCRVLGVSAAHAGGRVTYPWGDIDVDTGIVIPEGYDWHCWSAHNVWVQFGLIVGKLNAAPHGYFEVRHVMDNRRHILLKHIYTNNHQYYRHRAIFPPEQIASGNLSGVIAWPVSDAPQYGIRLFGKNNLSGVFDTSLLSYLVFKGETDITDGWTPGHIDARFSMNNCVCFFYTENPEAVIGIDYLAQNYRTWSRVGDIYGVRVDKIRARVCIFGNFPPATPGQYGIDIFNAAGQRVYNSSQAGMLRPVRHYMPDCVTIREGKLWWSYSTTPYRRPMYMPTNLAATVAGFTRNNRSKPVPVDTAFVSSDGYRLLPGWAGAEASLFSLAGDDSFPYVVEAPEVHCSANPVLVINAEDYFAF